MHRRQALPILIAAGAAAYAAYVFRRRRLARAAYAPLPLSCIHVASDAAHAERLLRCWRFAVALGLLPPALGLDVEWPPRDDGGRPVPALLQLSCGHRVLLVRLCKLRSTPPTLLAILRDASILLAGVGVGSDLSLLREALGVEPCGGVELVPLASASAGCDGPSLKQLAAQVLGHRMHKPSAVRSGDWAAAELSVAQVRYAADDADVALAILLELHRRHGVEWDGTGARLSLREWVASMAGAVAAPPRKRVRGPKPPPKPAAASVPKTPQRTSALYDGWAMLSPEGKVMCRVSQKRAEWYCSKGLAALEAGTPRTIRLAFEPRGLGNAGEPWLIEPKANACVGCGVAQRCGGGGGDGGGGGGGGGGAELIRWSVVPHSFRRLLPEEMRSRDSHDIVLLCRRCHQKVERPYAERRSELFAARGIREDTARVVDAPELARVKSAARLLGGSAAVRARVPARRLAELEAAVAAHFGVDAAALTPERVAEAAALDTKVVREGYVAPEAQLVARLREAGGGGDGALRELTVGYRRLFVDALAPSHLPAGWSVEHRSEFSVEEMRSRDRDYAAARDRHAAGGAGEERRAYLQGLHEGLREAASG